jgi:hypothetical protein
MSPLAAGWTEYRRHFEDVALVVHEEDVGAGHGSMLSACVRLHQLLFVTKI